MYFRARLDLSWGGIARALAGCLLPLHRGALERALGRPWGQAEQPVACLSVRTGFDALLTALALPPGSEVLLTALTIPDMPRLVRAHGLVPVPVDIDPDTLAPDQETLQAAWSPRSRVLVAAHLFGGVVDMGACRRFAEAHGLLCVEDVAQSWIPGAHAGSAESAVRLLSFGPIKTGTALGGALLLIRDPALRARVAAVLARHPVQTRWAYVQRVLKYGGMQLLTHPLLFGLFRRLCGGMGWDYDAVLREAARSYRGDDLLRRLRQQPSTPLLSMLVRRLTQPDHRVARRTAWGARVGAAITRVPVRPGTALEPHSHWLFPVLAQDPSAFIARARDAGFDATTGASSLGVVAPPEERPDATAPQAAWIARHLLFVPCYPELPGVATDRLIALLIEEGTRRPLVRPGAAPRWRGAA